MVKYSLKNQHVIYKLNKLKGGKNMNKEEKSLKNKKIKVALIASGSGTDAQAIMQAFRAKQIPNIDLKLLISTKPEAGCLKQANALQVPNLVIDRRSLGSARSFNESLRTVLLGSKIHLVFLVGCIVRIMPVEGIAFYNIHPADPGQFGGQGMYGLEVHKRVLLSIKDLLDRGRKKRTDRFFTYPTVHEVDGEYDSGQELIRLNVEIPAKIINDFMDGPSRPASLETATQALQQHVLPYEWEILPLAVNLAAKKIQQAKY